MARQAARASWVIFLVALVLAPGAAKGNEQIKALLLKSVPMLMLVGLGLGVIALSGLRKHRIRGILIPALIGILLNGSFFWALHRAREIALRQRQQQEVSRKAAVTLSDLFRQADQGMITNILPTGDARVDAGIRISAGLINKCYALRDKTTSEIKALGEQQELSALGSRSAIKSEMDKKVAAQKIIQNSQREFSSFVESTRKKLRASNLPKAMERSELRSLDGAEGFCSYIETGYSVRSHIKNAEFELLQFLWSEFGNYRLANGKVLFTSELKLQEFSRLIEKGQNFVREGQQLEAQHEAKRQAMRIQLEQAIRGTSQE